MMITYLILFLALAITAFYGLSDDRPTDTEP